MIMNEKLKSLVKKIILTSTAVLAGAGLSNSSAESNTNINLKKENELTKSKLERESTTPKLILQKAFKTSFTSLFHRSHRSHSSHRSHYSSYTQPKEDKKQKDENKEIRKLQGSDSKKVENKMIYELGSRVLKRNDVGTDVAELQDYLLQKGYKIKIDSEFGEATENAVKDFQKKNNIDVTGTVDVTTLYYIKKK